MSQLAFTDTMGGQKKVFTPTRPGKVSLYVCGITPYDYTHIGHARCYVTFDLLVRMLRFSHYEVTYVRNYTDIDDKILKKAEECGKNYQDLGNIFIESYQENMGQLGCIVPDYEPRVTQHIPEIIDFIKQLIDTGHAYLLKNDVYFDITTFPQYGKLSKKHRDDLLAGARVEIDLDKKNPEDFALWKGNSACQFWESPWGFGRPGWHIECSAMSKKYLGCTIDIHGGGADLVFPHHENEIAQSESLHGTPLARYWIHNAFVNVNKEKMSKSLGNTVMLNDILNRYDPMVVRYFLLQHHYRTPLDFSFDLLDQVSVAYKKLVAVFGDVIPIPVDLTEQSAHTFPVDRIIQSLSDDLNSPKAMGIVFQHLNTIKKNKTLLGNVAFLLGSVFGFFLHSDKRQNVSVTQEIQILIEKRDRARQDKDWQTADLLREQLATLGVIIHDKKL